MNANNTDSQTSLKLELEQLKRENEQLKDEIKRLEKLYTCPPVIFYQQDYIAITGIEDQQKYSIPINTVEFNVQDFVRETGIAIGGVIHSGDYIPAGLKGPFHG